MEPITRENFTAALERAVQEKGGDYKYPFGGACLYFTHEGGPSCIVGHALSYLGYGPEDVVEGTSASHVLGRLGVEDEDLLAAVHAAQLTQDAHLPWGQALDNYRVNISWGENREAF